MEWLRSIRGRLTSLAKRVRELERWMRDITKRIDDLEDFVGMRAEEVDHWT